MEENKLFNICLILSLLGLLFLTLYSENLELKETPIKDINYRLLNQRVKTSGIIDKISETQGLYLLNLKDGADELSVVIFKRGILALKKGMLVSVEGSVTEYQNETEIIAKRVEIK